MTHIFVKLLNETIRTAIDKAINVKPENQLAVYQSLNDFYNVEIDLNNLEKTIHKGNVIFRYVDITLEKPIESSIVNNPSAIDMCIAFESALQKAQSKYTYLEDIQVNPINENDITIIDFMSCS